MVCNGTTFIFVNSGGVDDDEYTLESLTLTCGNPSDR
jgi:hypothetical protein